jgi:hypothetical protein
MSNTRHASAGAPLRQERFASSEEFAPGLMANLVAKRCACLQDIGDRELLWLIQSRSWGPGGLRGFVADLLQWFPDEFATPTMRELGVGPRRVYTHKETLRVRDADSEEYYGLFNRKDAPWAEGDFALRGESGLRPGAGDAPNCYPASAFAEKCRAVARDRLEDWLIELCLNPQTSLSKGPDWLPEIRKVLRAALEQVAASERARSASTEIGRILADGLEFCLATRHPVLIDGKGRIGKSHEARAWTRCRPGSVRYFQVPSSTDEISFLIALARSLGVSVESSPKAHKLRGRIEQVLHSANLMLVVDEAHYCWPQSNYREALPKRIDYLLKDLADKGVAVALVTTPQFHDHLQRVEDNTPWASEQFLGRIGRYVKLPDRLSKPDLESVARVLLPDGDKATIRALADYADLSEKHVAAIRFIVDAARWIADKAGRQKPTAQDVRQAMRETLPGDTALTKAKQTAFSGRKARRGGRLQPPCKPNSEPVQRTANTALLDSPTARGITPSPTQLISTTSGG